MEEQTKTIKEKQLSLEYFFNGYIDYSRTDAARKKYDYLSAVAPTYNYLDFAFDYSWLDKTPLHNTS